MLSRPAPLPRSSSSPSSSSQSRRSRIRPAPYTRRSSSLLPAACLKVRLPVAARESLAHVLRLSTQTSEEPGTRDPISRIGQSLPEEPSHRNEQPEQSATRADDVSGNEIAHDSLSLSGEAPLLVPNLGSVDLDDISKHTSTETQVKFLYFASVRRTVWAHSLFSRFQGPISAHGRGD